MFLAQGHLPLGDRKLPLQNSELHFLLLDHPLLIAEPLAEFKFFLQVDCQALPMIREIRHQGQMQARRFKVISPSRGKKYKIFVTTTQHSWFWCQTTTMLEVIENLGRYSLKIDPSPKQNLKVLIQQSRMVNPFTRPYFLGGLGTKGVGCLFFRSC